MARKNSNRTATKPATDETPEFDPQAEMATDETPTAAPQLEESPPAMVDLAPQIALAVNTSGYAPDSVDFRGMTNRQRAGLYRGFVAAGRNNQRFAVRGLTHPDGKAVNVMGDFIRWLGEQLADAYEAETGRDPTEGLTFHA